MKGKVLKIGFVFMVLFSFVVSAGAEEAKPSALANIEEIKNALGLSIYVQGGYTYNLLPRRPDQRSEGSITEANSFTRSQIVHHDAQNGVGYKLKVRPATAKFIHAAAGSAGDDPTRAMPSLPRLH
jgi:hypothetical protein